jgi:murein L,D-transpeptidase YcbB/YkuD
MGRVKMHLFRDYYVHGTPAGNERHLGRPASHGCIRMRNQDVMELAQLVLKADGTPVAPATVEYLANNPRATRELALAGRVRVRIEYRLVDVDTDSVTLHPDVYGRVNGGYASRVSEELAQAGIDPTALLAQVPLNRAPLAGIRLAHTTTLASAQPVLSIGSGAVDMPALTLRP